MTLSQSMAAADMLVVEGLDDNQALVSLIPGIGKASAPPSKVWLRAPPVGKGRGNLPVLCGLSLNGSKCVPMSLTEPAELPTRAERSEIGETPEVSIMKSTQQWGKHLRERLNASLDPMVYALQWAQDPRCMQPGLQHRRVGAVIERNATICRLWLGKQR